MSLPYINNIQFKMKKIATTSFNFVVIFLILSLFLRSESRNLNLSSTMNFEAKMGLIVLGRPRLNPILRLCQILVVICIGLEGKFRI